MAILCTSEVLVGRGGLKGQRAVALPVNVGWSVGWPSVRDGLLLLNHSHVDQLYLHVQCSWRVQQTCLVRHVAHVGGEGSCVEVSKGDGRTVWGSNPEGGGGTRFTAPVQTCPGAHPASLYNGYRVFPSGKAAGAWR